MTLWLIEVMIIILPKSSAQGARLSYSLMRECSLCHILSFFVLCGEGSGMGARVGLK